MGVGRIIGAHLKTKLPIVGILDHKGRRHLWLLQFHRLLGLLGLLDYLGRVLRLWLWLWLLRTRMIAVGPMDMGYLLIVMMMVMLLGWLFYIESSK